MQVATIQHAKNNLEQLMRQVDINAEPVMILDDDSRKAVLLSEREFNAWRETDYLLSNPANAAHLRRSLEQADSGRVLHKELERGYRQMAEDEKREVEALEWAEATMEDVADV